MGPDGCLENIHTLLFMDDTVVFPTSRASLRNKLIRIKNCTDSTGMAIHPLNHNFLQLACQTNLHFMWEIYIYITQNNILAIGTLIANTSLSNQVVSVLKKEHGCTISCQANRCMFFTLVVVWDSAINSTLLSGCQTWLGASLLSLKRLYTSSFSAVEPIYCL